MRRLDVDIYIEIRSDRRNLVYSLVVRRGCVDAGDGCVRDMKGACSAEVCKHTRWCGLGARREKRKEREREWEQSMKK